MTDTKEPRQLQKERVGEVISDKMSKTIVVRVERRVAHPRFKKIITRYSKHYAHDEKEEASLGDVVRIRESRPLSRLKRWSLVGVVQKAAQQASVTAG
ncbi:MAG: 30S ribosomal protein S17 [Candidatus Hydrogenedentes bacterium]|jgi:small subunit ribosomal protein S17|nr:30S ribosomal protein S17 [Candidatus Hydrogenedentota bacterium]